MITFNPIFPLIPKGVLPGLVLCLMYGLSNNTSHADLFQSPLFLTTSVDPNVLINLSVEGPMGGAAYSDQAGNPASCMGRTTFNSVSDLGACYFSAIEYVGYFDPNKCYDYSSGQFNPSVAATSHACSSKWSGNFLNWATMTAIDEFIWTMTGGNRLTDTTTSTVVRRAQYNGSWFPVKVVNSTLNVAPSTVTPYSTTTLYIKNTAFGMNIGTTYSNATGSSPDKGSFNVNVKLCDTATNKETNCTAYTTIGPSPTTYYKPEGLIQKDANSKRFALTSYTLDNTAGRQGGVLRSNMKYVGPQIPDGSGGMINNPDKEFGTDGLLINNPVAATGGLNSGIINYINKFSDLGYKSKDPVSELFYESLRYFKNLGPTPENYSADTQSGVTAIARSSADTRAGGFWFYQAGEWVDPIQYSCQKNVMLAINDAYPWLDKRLPGTAFTEQTITTSAGNGTYDLNDPRAFGNPSDTYKPSGDWGQPSNHDTAMDAKSLTNSVGAMENGRNYPAGNPAYTFNLNSFKVGGGNGTHDKDSLGKATCAAKNISTAGLGSVMATCPASASSTDQANRDNTYYVAGLAWYANTTDLRSDISDTINNPPKWNDQTVSTYMIDTQEYSSTPNIGPTNPLWLTGKYGGFTDSNADKNPNTAKAGAVANSEWDINADGEPDNYLLASNPTKLVNALKQSFISIDKKKSAASGAAANSTQLNTGTQVYQARFDSSDWSGEIRSFNVALVTGVLTPNWTSSLPVSRNIFTYNPTAAAGSRGVPFQWTNLTTTPVATSQQAYLNTLNGIVDTTKGTLRLDWLRGDAAKEQKNAGGIFRNRTNPLGDIINSDSVFVGTEDFGYGTGTSLSNPEQTTYTAFRAFSAYINRTPMLYAGANDGMLHGFNATQAGGGQEVFAYIPNVLFPELSKLTDLGYRHQYYVDGSSAVSDVYDPSITGSWRTLLAGTTGAGGKAVFALDITNPSTFGIGSALWEFTNVAPPVVTNCSAFDIATPSFTSANYDTNDLGFTLAQPSVVRTQNGKWVVIVANGYESVNGHAVLFVLDAKTGCMIRKIDTGVGTSAVKNGLATPVAVDTDNDRSVDTVYAGDLYGNLWKFDLSSTAASSSWAVANGGAPLFVACTTTGTGASCPAANRQPITGKPNMGSVRGAGTDQNSVGRMVYFGTGKYFETGDNIVGPGSQVQTFYGLWDQGSAITDRASLQEQTIEFDGFPQTTCPSGTGTCTSARRVRVVSKNPVCYSVTSPLSPGCTASSPLKKGWALNLVAVGERMVSFPLVRRGLVIFSTAIPDPDPCSPGGRSFLMEIDALSGGESSSPAFDVNGSRTVSNDDFVTVNGISRAASGQDLGIGITDTPVVVESPSTSSTPGVDFKYLSGTSGSMADPVNKGADGGGGSGSGTRKSWRQLR